jgi:hypothetical protein
LVPGYGTDGKLDQLYRRVRVLDKGEWSWVLMPTPGVWPEGRAHALHLPAADFDPACPDVYVCEGPWDGMALWEVVRGLALAPCQVVAVPGCNVWRDEWTDFCQGKRVVLLYDNDHPKALPSGREYLPGRDGMRRAARMLSGAAASVRCVRWGPDGYDPDLPSGYDVRDLLSTDGNHDPDHRSLLLGELLAKVEDAPPDWFSPTVASATPGGRGWRDEPIPCSSFADLEAAWQEAMHWRPDMRDALAVLLAVCASTQQAGNQLFLDLVGSPGGAKTTLCRGLLVSEKCIHLENVTKLLSGWKKPKEADKDCSFLARANGKTWVTCEFDVLASSLQYKDLMSKVRRIFDGETTATYGNHDEDRVYAALRTPWIRAGTPRMMDHDQAALGDRFLRYMLLDPQEGERRAVTRRALRAERSAMLDSANCTSGSTVDAETRQAHALTGGYVDWLRSCVEERLQWIEVSDAVEEECLDLAELCADLRARPQAHRHQFDQAVESHEYKELPTRLARQNVRLASCLAVVLNRDAADADVMRVVRKVAMDTACGHTSNIVRWLCSPKLRGDGETYQEGGGLATGLVELWTGMSAERAAKYLAFLSKIGVVEWRETRTQAGWVLTERVHQLYTRVQGR